MINSDEQRKRAKELGLPKNIGRKVKISGPTNRRGEIAEIVGWGLRLQDLSPYFSLAYYIRFEDGECWSISAEPDSELNGFPFID